VTDLIRLQGLRLMGTHGALPEEQGRAQPFEVDVDMVVDLALAGRTDALADTVHYGDVSLVVEKVVTGEQHRLLERLATRVADDVLKVDRRITSVTVTVRKLRPPLAVDLSAAAVTITRP
jgi:dihydroneopterin aldolase